MAKISLSHLSKVLNRHVDVIILLPDELFLADDTVKDLPVLYLLHGLSGSQEVYTRFTSIEEMARKKKIIVVMPDGDNSFYTDSVWGENYYTYIHKELPKFIKQMLPITSSPTQTYIAGNSMGGYGALKLGLSSPENYGAIGLFSALADIKFAVDNQKEYQFDIARIFGTNNLVHTEHDPLELLSRCIKENKEIPPIFSRCGSEDFLLEVNRHFSDTCKKNDVSCNYLESPGAHTWSFWNQCLSDFFSWLPIEDV